MEFNEGEFALEIFRQCGAVLDPVTAVHVKHIAEIANFRAMNVPANHAVHLALARELDHRVFIIRDVFHRGLGFEFDVGSERPIAETQRAPCAIDPDV